MPKGRATGFRRFIHLTARFEGVKMLEEIAKKSVKVASKTVRVSAELARFLEENCEAQQLKQSELLDKIFEGYLRREEGALSGQCGAQFADTFGGDSSAHMLQVLAGIEKLNRRLDMVTERPDENSIHEKQNGTFELLNKQLQGLAEATQKYGIVSNLISASSSGIKDGLAQAENAIEKILDRTNAAVNQMEDLVKSQQDSTRQSVGAAETFAASLGKLKESFSGYVEEELKQPTTRLLREIESETRSELRSVRIRANISVGCSILAVGALAIIVGFSYSPLSSYSRGMEDKYKTFHQAYFDLRGRVCAIKPGSGIKELQDHFCKKT